jgi:hypothetical protein
MITVRRVENEQNNLLARFRLVVGRKRNFSQVTPVLPHQPHRLSPRPVVAGKTETRVRTALK